MSDLKPLYLTKLHLKGYKSIIDCEFEINKGLNILIGKNGAGKSNLFDSIENVLNPSTSKSNFKFSNFIFLTEDENSFEIEYERIAIDIISKLDDLTIPKFNIKRKLFINQDLKHEGFSDSFTSEIITFQSKEYVISRSIGSFFVEIGYKFPWPLYMKFGFPENLDCIEKAGIIEIDLNGGIWYKPKTLNFLNNLFWRAELSMQLENGTSSLLTRETIKDELIIPENIILNLNKYSPIKSLRFNTNINIYEDDNQLLIENLKIEFLVNDTWLSYSQLSDGTKRLFYIITEITAKESGLILIEEPELGIHPHQFSLLMDFIKKESETKQIIISTHSPKALDHLDKDELDNILIASYEKSEGTQVRHLTIEEKEHAANYREDVGFLSDFWLYSSLEE
jgi:AAA15 family ATPase/GTPase